MLRRNFHGVIRLRKSPARFHKIPSGTVRGYLWRDFMLFARSPDSRHLLTGSSSADFSSDFDSTQNPRQKKTAATGQSHRTDGQLSLISLPKWISLGRFLWVDFSGWISLGRKAGYCRTSPRTTLKRCFLHTLGETSHSPFAFILALRNTTDVLYRPQAAGFLFHI